MPCDTKLRTGQTIQERKEEIKQTVATLDALIRAKRVRPVVGPQGAIAFEGWQEADRNRVTDACAYRRIMATGSALARAELARSEQLAGRSIDRRVVAHGAHSHDGGRTWHDHKG